jgi:hypothetical protein
VPPLYHSVSRFLEINCLQILYVNLATVRLFLIVYDTNICYLKTQVLRDVTPGHWVYTSHIPRGQKVFILGSNNLLELLTQRQNVASQTTMTGTSTSLTINWRCLYPIQRAYKMVVWRNFCQNNWAVSIQISQVFNKISAITLVSLSTCYNF